MSARRVIQRDRENVGCSVQSCIQKKIICPCTTGAPQPNLARSAKRAALSNLQDTASGNYKQGAQDSHRVYGHGQSLASISSGYDSIKSSVQSSYSRDTTRRQDGYTYAKVPAQKSPVNIKLKTTANSQAPQTTQNNYLTADVGGVRTRALSSREGSNRQYTAQYHIDHRTKSVGSENSGYCESGSSAYGSLRSNLSSFRSNVSQESNVHEYGFLFDNNKITFRREYPRESTRIDDNVFVDAPIFFEGNESVRDFKNSPLTLPIPVRRSTVNEETSLTKRNKPNKPAEKTTLTKRLQRRQSLRLTAYTCDIYVSEYLEDLTDNLRRSETNFLLRNNDIKQYFEIDERAVTLDWLLQISVAKLCALCAGKYSKQEILGTEKLVLDKIGFNISIADPYIFLHFFMKELELEKNELLVYGASFVIECCILLDKFPLIPPSYLAQAALFVAYNVINGGEHAAYFYQQFPKWNVHTLRTYSTVLIKDVKCIIENKEVFRGITMKYETKEKLFVYQSFLDLN